MREKGKYMTSELSVLLSENGGRKGGAGGFIDSLHQY